LGRRLSDHAAPQQEDDSAMVARWDAILLAATVAGGSMMIEHSHRLDTGAPDEEAVATSACDAPEPYAWKPVTRPTGEEGDDGATALTPSGCSPE
jgi:hypothetical protein